MRIPAPNYTQTPNDLFDHWLPLLGEAELKVLLVIMRKTFGWHKVRDRISTTQLSRLTGMLQETVIKAAKSLQNKGIILREVVGPVGKQETYYELVITEDSNNYYPSVEPRRPLGLDPGVSTEAQKKHSSLKETTTKERKAAAAASFSSEENQHIEEKVYPILKDIDIPINDKVYLTKNYSKEQVAHAIKWSQHPSTKLNKELSAALKWACQTQPTIPIEKLNVESENKSYAHRYDEMSSGSTRINAFNDHVEFVWGGVYGHLLIRYDDNGFMEQFKNTLRKHGFRILE